MQQEQFAKTTLAVSLAGGGCGAPVFPLIFPAPESVSGLGSSSFSVGTRGGSSGHIGLRGPLGMHRSELFSSSGCAAS